MIPVNIKWIIDFSLGDGGIYYINTKLPIYQETHSAKQIEYINHKKDILSNLGYDMSTYEYDVKEYRCVRIRSKTHKDFDTAHKWIYNKNRKSIDKALLHQLDARSLAYYYMDDGDVNKKHTVIDNIKYTKAGHYRLATHNMSINELELFRLWLLEQFNIQSNKYQQGNGYRLYISRTESKDIFREIIKPYIVPSMMYKINIPHTYKDAMNISALRD